MQAPLVRLWKGGIHRRKGRERRISAERRRREAASRERGGGGGRSFPCNFGRSRRRLHRPSRELLAVEGASPPLSEKDPARRICRCDSVCRPVRRSFQVGSDLYVSNEPQKTFHKRIRLCLDLFNDAVKVRVPFRAVGFSVLQLWRGTYLFEAWPRALSVQAMQYPENVEVQSKEDDDKRRALQEERARVSLYEGRLSLAEVDHRDTQLERECERRFQAEEDDLGDDMDLV